MKDVEIGWNIGKIGVFDFSLKPVPITFFLIELLNELKEGANECYFRLAFNYIQKLTGHHMEMFSLKNIYMLLSVYPPFPPTNSRLLKKTGHGF